MGAHHHHDHTDQSDTRLIWAVGANVALTVAQVIGGIAAGSLSLLADALHNLSDAASLGIALVARRVARKPADEKRTFGYRRAEVIGALINLTTLIIIGLYLMYEAVARVLSPEPVEGWIVVIVAGIALAVDIGTAMLTYAMSKDNMNIRAAFVHNVSDAMASVGVIIAGTLIILYQWHIADLIATIIISAYVLYQGITMLPRAVHILMEGMPPNLEMDDIIGTMTAVDGVVSVHHVHAWELDEHHRALEAHVVVDSSDPVALERIKRDLKARCADELGVQHTTLELEWPDHMETPCTAPDC